MDQCKQGIVPNCLNFQSLSYESDVSEDCTPIVPDESIDGRDHWPVLHQCLRQWLPDSTGLCQQFEPVARVKDPARLLLSRSTGKFWGDWLQSLHECIYTDEEAQVQKSEFFFFKLGHTKSFYTTILL